MRKASPELISHCQFMYDMLIANSSNPEEAAMILTYLWTRLWLNCRTPEADVEKALAIYMDGIRQNIKLNETPVPANHPGTNAQQ